MADLSASPPPAVKTSASGDGDWSCEECGNLNFARRTLCNRCQKGKAPSAAKKRKLGTEIGKAAAEKSRGLFSADDWQCNKCGNVNWARRQQCNVCNAPKFGEVEERTGLGGGYNDRGIVEYKERNDSDDEYDEFGRKKKRRYEEKSNSSSRRHNSKEKEEEPEEEEEEEDDDDGDLSKYDLSEWGDLDNDKKTSSKSRSPSSKK